MKKMLLTALCAVSFGIVQAQNRPTVAKASPTVTEPDPTVSFTPSDVSEPSLYEQIPFVGDLLQFARRHLSVRYRSGGTTPRGFDCSGFTRFCFSQFGIALPHSSAAQGNLGSAIDKADAQPGDLIVFKGSSAASKRVGHVGLITEVVGNRIKFIHSAWNGGVRYDYLHADYYQRRFMGIRRVASLLAER